MSKQLTFGKYNGKTALEVAMIDEGYATWAANNLKSGAWQAEFKSALAQLHGGKLSAEVVGKTRYNAALQSDTGHEMDNISAEDFVAEAAAELSERAAYAKLLATYAKALGCNVEKLKSIYHAYGADVKANAFSTTEKYNAYMQFVRAYDAHCEKYF